MWGIAFRVTPRTERVEHCVQIGESEILGDRLTVGQVQVRVVGQSDPLPTFASAGLVQFHLRDSAER
jgi:hypothetical protein